MNKNFCDLCSSFFYEQKMNRFNILKNEIQTHIFFENIDFLDKDMKNGLLDLIYRIEGYYLNMNNDENFVDDFYNFEYYLDMYVFGIRHDKLIVNPKNLNKELEIEWAKNIKNFFNDTFFWDYNIYNLKNSEPTFFDGDIIITDPCYIMKEEDWDNFCDGNKNIFKEKIPSIIWRDTLYGDWSCSVFSNNKIIGNFCADAGMVCVAKLNEVLNYNPNFDYHINKPWTTTLIKNFNGFVNFDVLYYNTNMNLMDQLNNDLNNKKLNDLKEITISSSKEITDKWKDIFCGFYVQVVGNGINNVTKEKMNWFGSQTGF